MSAYDGSVRILDVKTKAQIGIIHTALNVSSMLTNSNEPQLAVDTSIFGAYRFIEVDSIAFGGTGLIQIETGEVLYNYQELTSELKLVGRLPISAFNTNGDYLTAQFTGNDVILVNHNSNSIYRLSTTGRNVILTFSEDGETLAANGEDLTLWNTRTGEIISDIKTERLSVNQRPIVSPDGKYVALIEGDDQTTSVLRIWDVHTGQVVSELPSGNAILFHPNLQIVAIANQYNIRIWNVDTGDLIHKISLTGFNGFYDKLLFSPTGKHLIIGLENTIYILNLETFDMIHEVSHDISMNEIIVSGDESLMIASDIEGNLLIWDYANFELLTSIQTRPIGIRSMLINQDNDIIFVLSNDGVVSLWGILMDQ